MRPFIWNLLLALVWMALSGMFSLAGFVAGLVVGFLVLAVAGHAVGARSYGVHVGHTVGFLGFYLWELLQSNARVAVDVMRPRMRSRPGFVAIPVTGLSNTQITLLANLITMTPGTLSIDVSQDRSTLYIHGMFVDDPETVRTAIVGGLVRRVREVIA